MIPTPDDIRTLRDARGESRSEFGKISCVSGRTIESWEQLDPEDHARRRPRGLALDKLLKLLRKQGA